MSSHPMKWASAAAILHILISCRFEERTVSRAEQNGGSRFNEAAIRTDVIA